MLPQPVAEKWRSEGCLQGGRQETQSVFPHLPGVLRPGDNGITFHGGVSFMFLTPKYYVNSNKFNPFKKNHRVTGLISNLEVEAEVMEQPNHMLGLEVRPF